ncbi:cupin domain-containing protein [Chryseolinea sp. T2]|uniref:cupin domain-containing protein n=1 Tax=Chryseolinea sp. T2 TaxID=3129255 RepID=UPI0030768C94
MRYSYPHTIDNGHGEEITFVRFISTNDGGILEIENKVKPGAGPPMHVHHLQDESLTVIQGKIAGQVLGEKTTYHGPGETVTFKRGVAHRFWNAGDDLLICRGSVSPAYNLEYFLTAIFESTKGNRTPRPQFFDGAFLQTRYKSEFDLVEIPGFVKRVVFPIVTLIGGLTGSHHKFKDCPHPVRQQ